MNLHLIYTQLMLLTLLILLGSGCSRDPNESPIQFEEKTTRNTENMTPAEWETFKNKAIESIIQKYQLNHSDPSEDIKVVDLNNSASIEFVENSKKNSDDTLQQRNVDSGKILHVPENLSPSTVSKVKPPLEKSESNTFEKVDRYSQLKIKPEETKGKHYKVPPNAVVKSQTKEFLNASSVSQYIWPVKGKIIKDFGQSEKGFHNGINIKAPAGSPVMAIENGKVIFVGAIKGMGKVILIEHTSQMIAAYALVGNISVRATETVKKGQKIAEILSTDGKDGEFHFELRKGTHPVNPKEYLKK